MVKSLNKKIKIEKNIPKAESRGRRFGENIYPFAEMKVGDSFAIEIGKRNELSVRSSLSTTARLWAMYHQKDWKFTTSIKQDKGKVRIWRVQ